MLHSRIFHVNLLETNCVLLWNDGNPACVLADPGMSSPDIAAEVLDFIRENGLVLEAILLTHGHFDHLWGVAHILDQCPVPVYLHPADKPIQRMGTAVFRGMQSFSSLRSDFPTLPVADGDTLTLGGTQWTVLGTPGHTPGSVCYWSREDGLLLSGDTLFAGSIGRTDLEGGDYDALMQSLLDKVMRLPGETDVIPGHGLPTTIATESASNPFLQPFNEPDPDWNREDGIPIQGL